MTRHDFKRALATLLAASLAAPQAAFAAEAAKAAAGPAIFQGVDISDDFVAVKLSTGVQYNSFMTVTPPRLILDLIDTKNAAPAGSTKGAGKILLKVRSSQFQTQPKFITRIVLDLMKTAGYKVSALPNGLGVQLVSPAAHPAAVAAAAEEQEEEAAPEEETPAPAPAPAPKKVSAPRPAAVAAASKPAPAPAPAPAPTPAPEAAAAEAPTRPAVSAPVPAAPAPAPAPAVAPAAEEPAPAPALVSAPAAPAARADEDESEDVAEETPEPPTKPVRAATTSALAVEAPAPPVPEKLGEAAAFKRAGLTGKMHSELVATAQYEDTSKSRIDLPTSVKASRAGGHRLGGRIYADLVSRLPKDPVTLDFDGTDIRDVIKLLAAKSRINIIYGADVNGSLTLHLADVPFDEAFRTVLSMMQLTTSQVGDNVLRVVTPAELTRQRSTGTTVTKVIPLNYATPQAVKMVVDQVRTAEGRSGNTAIDAKTNSIIVTETLEGLLATENLVAQLDQRPTQVLIEAKLVEVDASTSFNYGVQWSQYSAQPGTVGGQQGLTAIGSPTGFATTTSNAPATFLQPGTSGGFLPIGASGNGTGVSLPADSVFGALTLGRITNSYIINATITAAASEGKAKVLSDPKIATLNNQAATINVTTQIPYVTANVASTGVQTQTVTYVTTGITLTVTPNINADGRIQLLINPNVSQPSATAAANTQTGAPGIDSRNATTTVLVRDGESIVIGGLISDSVSDTISKIPFFGDIPILGWLFKKKDQSRKRTELLIFVTTHIMPD